MPATRTGQIAVAVETPAIEVIRMQHVGTVTHYFPHVDAAVIRVEGSNIRLGDTLQFQGYTTDFEQRIDRLELDHQSIEVGFIGQAIAVQVRERVREHDRVSRKLP